MSNSVRPAAILIFLGIAASIGPSETLAETVDPVAVKLSRARVRYEAAMERMRDSVQKAIKQMIAATRPDKGNNDAIKKLGDEKDAFKSTGAIPDVPNASEIRTQAAKAGQGMSDAYSAALKAYTNSDKDALRDAVRAESDQFDKQSDIVPWGENLIGKKPAAERTLAGGGKALSVEIGMDNEYRIEINCRRVADTGALFVEIPLVNGKRLETPVAPDDEGAIRVLLTVRENVVSADLGLTRPVDLAKAKEAKGKAVSLRADGGGFIVESVRVKAVITGEREQVVDRKHKSVAKGQPRGKQSTKDDPSAQLTTNSEWSGKRSIHGNGEWQDCVITVARRDGNTSVLTTRSWGGEGTLIITLKVNGGRVSVIGLRYEGPNPRSFTDVAGSGSISGGALNFSYSCRVTIGKNVGQPDSSAFNVQRQ